MERRRQLGIVIGIAALHLAASLVVLQIAAASAMGQIEFPAPLTIPERMAGATTRVLLFPVVHGVFSASGARISGDWAFVAFVANSLLWGVVCVWVAGRARRVMSRN